MTSQPFEVRVLNLALNPLREFIAKKSASQQMSAQESKCLVDRAWNPLFTPQSIVFAKAADSGFNGKSGIVSAPHRDQGDSAGSILGYRVLSRAQLNHCWLAMFTPKVLRSFLKQEPHAAKVPYYHRWLRLIPRRNWHQSASRRYWISAHQASYLLQSGIRRGVSYRLSALPASFRRDNSGDQNEPNSGGQNEPSQLYGANRNHGRQRFARAVSAPPISLAVPSAINSSDLTDWDGKDETTQTAALPSN